MVHGPFVRFWVNPANLVKTILGEGSDYGKGLFIYIEFPDY